MGMAVALRAVSVCTVLACAVALRRVGLDIVSISISALHAYYFYSPLSLYFRFSALRSFCCTFPPSNLLRRMLWLCDFLFSAFPAYIRFLIFMTVYHVQSQCFLCMYVLRIASVRNPSLLPLLVLSITSWAMNAVDASVMQLIGIVFDILFLSISMVTILG